MGPAMKRPPKTVGWRREQCCSGLWGHGRKHAVMSRPRFCSRSLVSSVFHVLPLFFLLWKSVTAFALILYLSPPFIVTCRFIVHFSKMMKENGVQAICKFM